MVNTLSIVFVINASMRMHFLINSAPDPSCEASHPDIFVDKSALMVMFRLLSCNVLGSELP